MHIQLSIVLIIKNEAKNLSECLQSVQDLNAEIIILDSGSDDDTIKIAKKFTDKIFVNKTWQGFGKQRQIAQNYAGGDWVLMLDADERLTPKLIDEIKVVLTKNNQNEIYNLSRLSWAFGDFIRHGGWYPDNIARLYPRIKASYNDNLVHEKLHIPKTMTVVNLKENLLHYTYDNLEHYLIKSAKYSTAWAKQRQAKGKKSSIFKGVTHGIFYFIKAYIFRLGFLDGRQGLLLALLSTHSVFSKYANLWIMNQAENSLNSNDTKKQ